MTVGQQRDGSSLAVAAWQWCGVGGSLAVAVAAWQGQQRGDSGSMAAVAAVAAGSGSSSLATARQQQQRGGVAVAAAAGLRRRRRQLSSGAAVAAWWHLQQRVSIGATRETTTTTTTLMTTTIALPAMIKLMGAVVLVPHLAHHGFNVIVVVTALSCAFRKHANTCAFKCHQYAKVYAFVLGQGRRDNSTNDVVVGDSGACGDIHRGRYSADNTEGSADDIIC